jgi:hypothetical protein
MWWTGIWIEHRPEKEYMEGRGRKKSKAKNLPLYY